MPSVLNAIDFRRKLTRQNPEAPFRVLHNRSGTNLVATVIEWHDSRQADQDNGIEISKGFIADTQTHVFETGSLGEAHYLAAILNSLVVDALIKPSQTRGLFGKRDIYTRPFKLPIPKFDESNDTHRCLAELGQACHELVAEALPEIAARYRSTGKIRGEVRRLLADQLVEIDGLVRELLNLPPKSD